MQCPPTYRPGGPCAAPQGAPSATQQCRRLVHARKGLHGFHFLGEERVVVNRAILELDLFLRAQASASARRRTGQHISTTAAERKLQLGMHADTGTCEAPRRGTSTERAGAPCRPHACHSMRACASSNSCRRAPGSPRASAHRATQCAAPRCRWLPHR